LIFEKEKPSRSRFTTFGLTILLAFASAALAVDGTVLINQSTVTTGLTGCPTGGHFPIIICQSGSYRLSGNLTVPDANTTAINMTADNVSLDLNGFAILGPANCTPGTFPVQCSTTGFGDGIASFRNNISVSNGTISGMGAAGIRLLGFGGRIDGLRVENNAGVNSSSLSSLGGGVHCIANCDQYDPEAVAGGIIAVNANISNCKAMANAQHGIYVLGSGMADRNTVSYNGGFGIVGSVGIISVFFGINGALVATNNSVFSNGQDGMNRVALGVNNTFVANLGFGFSCAVATSAPCAFEGNMFRLNGLNFDQNSTSLGHNFCGGAVC
jgi:hypothetical protein